jgi:2-dehydro-3-deoxyglucarate aldolase
MIEDHRAVKDLDAILGVPGLDALLIGPYDLSASMGITAQFGDAGFVSVLRSIREQAQARSIACGIHVVAADPTALKGRIAEGYRFLAYSIDAVFLTTSAQRPPT